MHKASFRRYNDRIPVWYYIIPAVIIMLFLIYIGVLSGFSLDSYRTARLRIEIGQNERLFEGQVIKGMTILEAINASALAGGIKFNYFIDGIDNKLVINSLDGYSRDKNELDLVIYKNDSIIDVSQIHILLIKPSDSIVIKSK